VPSLELIDSATGRLQLFSLTKDLISLGRDPSADVRLDTGAGMVSRRHAELRRQNNQFMLADLNSFNGTFHNNRRITAPTPLFDGDQIQLGTGGSVCLFRDPTHLPSSGQGALETIVLSQSGSGSSTPQQAPTGNAQLELRERRVFDKPMLTVGRAANNEIHLDGLQISNYHAQISLKSGAVVIEDKGSTNGVYVNGVRITSTVSVRFDDVVQIGPFVFEIDTRTVSVYDARAKTRIDAMGIDKIVPNRSGKGKLKLLDNVDLAVNPNEFIGLLGPSGAGKSTLMDALNGMRPATNGQVLVNNLDLYQHLDSLKQSIGYVPQDDIIHRELTVWRTLYYVARLRLSHDVTEAEINQIISEVMDVTGLAERRDVLINRLSGGQRKRVSIAVELITKPSVIFLDEPTSGLDPGTEEKIMRLFRQIAESGRTVILTTHAMENVKLFDKIVVLMRGKLVFYGAPQEALAHVKASSFKDLYDKLEGPVEERLKKLPSLPLNAPPDQTKARKLEQEKIAEDVANEWRQKFEQTEQYKHNILTPLGTLKTQTKPAAPAKRRPTVTDSVRQWKTLAQRYFEVLACDRLNLFILFIQAPIIALLTYIVVGNKDPRDFLYFVLALVAVWFGASIAAREIIRERAVYNRERMVNLGLLPYLGSKLLVLSLIVGLQCVLLFVSLKLMKIIGMEMPGDYAGVPQLGVMILTGMVGIALGLFVSAMVKTSEMATSLVPLILIPQILFCGLVGVPKDLSKVAGLVMPATWAFDEMKRTSSLDVLRGKDEQAQESAKNEGRGEYKQVERENQDNIDKATQKIKDYKAKAEKSMDDFKARMDTYQEDMKRYARQEITTEPVKPKPPKLDEPPKVDDAVKLKDDLSGFVDFLHPWGGVWLNPFALLLMFFGLVLGSILILRSQDIG
jgi:ABC-type multidrug transport system ATPase subunit/pSer/pThr/pTyr-binding forkhead associated (FHA) protein